MNKDVFLSARLCDISSLANGDRPVSWQVLHGETPEIVQRERREETRTEALLGSKEFLGELLPFYKVDQPLTMPHLHGELSWASREDVFRPTAGDLFRFNTDDANCLADAPVEVIKDLPAKLERAIKSCRARRRLSKALVKMVLAIPTRAKQSHACVDILKRNRDLFESGLKITSLEIMNWVPLTLNLEALQAVIAGLIPLSELAVELCQVHLGKLPPESVIRKFRPLWGWLRFYALPPVFKAYRPYLYETIKRAFERATAEGDAFELFARLYPTPFDLLDDFLEIAERARWFSSFNEAQLARVSHLLFEISCSYSEAPQRQRQRIWSRYVSWLESPDLHLQLLARYFFLRLSWRVRDNESVLSSGSSKASSSELDNHGESVATTISSGLFEIRKFIEDANTQIVRPDYLDSSALSALNRRSLLHPKEEAITYKIICSTSANELGRVKAIWNLGRMAKAEPCFRETAYNAYHCSRGSGELLGTARNRVRDMLGGFCQDWGPVTSVDGRESERAAANVVAIVQGGLMRKLINWTQRNTGLPRQRCEEMVFDYLAECTTHPRLSANLAQFDIHARGAMTFLWRSCYWWVMAELRKEKLATKRLLQGAIGAADHRNTGSGLQASNDVRFTCSGKTHHRDEASVLVREGLRELPIDQAAAAFYRVANGCSRDETAQILRLQVERVDYLMRQATPALEEAVTRLSKHDYDSEFRR